jgi:hypothetical protein
VAALLNFNKQRKKDIDTDQKDQAKKQDFDDILTMLKNDGVQKAQPSKVELSEKEKARARRERLEKLAEQQAEEGEKDEVLKKREVKLQSKQE